MRHARPFLFGVRRQSEAATALWMNDKLQLPIVATRLIDYR
jgi:hypothetical protein